MRELTKFLKDIYQIIEFSSQESLFAKVFHERNGFLSITRDANAEGEKTIFLEETDFTRAIEKNSTDAIILNCTGWNELRALQKTVGTVFFFERITAFNIIFLFYFLLRGKLAFCQAAIPPANLLMFVKPSFFSTLQAGAARLPVMIMGLLLCASSSPIRSFILACGICIEFRM